MLNIIIADDDKLHCDALAQSIQNELLFENVFCAYDGIEVLEIVQKHSVTVIIMDVVMPHKNGLETSTEVLKKFPEIKIICTSLLQSFDQFFTMRKLGIVGFIQKGSKPSVYNAALQAVLKNNTYFEEQILKYLNESGLLNEKKHAFKTFDEYRITPTQTLVLKYICNGLKNTEITNELNISVGSVEKHIHNLLEKFDVENRKELKAHYLVAEWFAKQ
jgi:DNA-binding NarL/FixJ family response regulator